MMASRIPESRSNGPPRASREMLTLGQHPRRAGEDHTVSALADGCRKRKTTLRRG
jgi:hypothetical protein